MLDQVRTAVYSQVHDLTVLRVRAAFVCASMYQLWIPFSVVRGIILPLYVGYACYDRLFTTPLALSVLWKAAFMLKRGYLPCLL